MLSYRVACVGRRAQDPLLNVAQDYEARLKRYVSFDLQRVRESEPKREGELLLGHVSDCDRLVVLDETGEQATTRQLATKLQTWQDQGYQRVGFLIGGADGLHEAVKSQAHGCWGLSRLTLPHRLALVVLLEQLYRIQTIFRGEKYHRD